MSTLPPSTANWHWKSKSVTPWARNWFETELPTVIFTKDDVTVGVQKVTEVDGDVELGMRKSKLITIYDCKIVLEWTATHSDGTKAEGKLTIPEVSHEITLDGLSDYVFEWTLTSPASSPFYDLTKKGLPPLLISKLSEFPKVLVETHGRDLTVGSETATPSESRSDTPAPAAGPAAKAAPAKATAAAAKVINTSTVSVEASFMASAVDLFEFLTDEKKIPIWSRAPAKSNPTPSSSFSLFGGGVTGEYVSVEKPTKIVQTWRLQSPTWPAGHHATLTTTLVQAAESTTIRLELDGVPKGQEDEIQRNLQGYYINSLKSIGYVQVQLQTPARRDREETPPPPPTAPSRWLAAGILLALLGALVLPLLARFSS